MPDEDRVFDVARPGRGTPQATSKPVIVGHSPTNHDPMVNQEPRPATAISEPTHISVQDDSAAESALTPLAPTNYSEPSQAPQSSWNGQISSESGMSSDGLASALGVTATGPEAEEANQTSAPDINNEANPQPDNTVEADTNPLPPTNEHVGHVEGLHISQPKRKSRLPWILLFLLGLVVGAYLAIDSGLIKTSIDLPFHIFKQKTTTTVSTSKPNVTPAATVPNGFTVYKIANSPITFAAPVAWGEPVSVADPGYASRSEGAKSDGVYAYIVDFATNKDVEVAVTSSKFLPAARAVLYYDHLDWCTGSNDGKIYLGSLHFTTTNKVDTPGTVSCDQGPITGATKLNSTTIVELNSKNADGSSFGDLYTKNLTDKEFTVFRVRDKSMKSSTEIKQLLNTIKISSASAANSGQ